MDEDWDIDAGSNWQWQDPLSDLRAGIGLCNFDSRHVLDDTDIQALYWFGIAVDTVRL